MFQKCPVKKVIFPNQHTWNIRRCEMFMLDSIKCIFNYNVSGLKVGYHLVIVSLCLFFDTHAVWLAHKPVFVLNFSLHSSSASKELIFSTSSASEKHAHTNTHEHMHVCVCTHTQPLTHTCIPTHHHP